MKSKIRVLISIALIYLGSATNVQAGCELYFTVWNDFPNVALNIEKIKSAAYYQGAIPTGGLIYKKQWAGHVRIPVGDAHLFTFRVDNDCTYIDVGNIQVDNKWNVRVFRENGTKHTCFNIVKFTNVRLTKPDGCSK